MASLGRGEDKATGEGEPAAGPEGLSAGNDAPKAEHKDGTKIEDKEAGEPSSPEPQTPLSTYQQPAYQAHLTPQPSAGYYLYPQSQVTPEPPGSPLPGSRAYDIASLIHQQQALGHQVVLGNPFTAAHQYGSPLPQAPLSPSRSGANGSGLSIGVIPPPSPLFPRTAAPGNAFQGNSGEGGEQQGDVNAQRNTSYGEAPPSPGVPFMSSNPLGGAGIPGYGVHPGYGIPNPNNGSTPSAQDQAPWNERGQQGLLFYPQSPTTRLPPAGMPVQYAPGARGGNNDRAFSNSFDDLLPPSALEPQDSSQAAAYPQYTGLPNAAGGGATLFAHQQPWGYNSVGGIFSIPQSPVQQRGHHNMQNSHMGHQGFGGPPSRMYGYPYQEGGMPFYPATSPGPPIQTTASNKGPDGANLFIFHIPNHFTNLDMYHLFGQYGNLLSVRIMVEKETGRSRGFGFVSYDSPESAAMAIKELNGFAIGNKRLKVQHKQIRPNDQPSYQQSSYSSSVSNGSYGRNVESEHPMHTHYGGAAPHWYIPGGGENRENQNGNLERVSEVDNTHGKNESLGSPNENAGLDSGTLKEAMSKGPTTSNSPLSSLEPIRNALPDVSDS